MKIKGLSKIFVFTVMAGCCSAVYAQKPKIGWLTIAEAENAVAIEKKPVLIDLYTDWCTWCKVMDHKTYTNKKLVAYVQERYYPVKINAESKSAIKWKGRTFNFSQAYHANEFAVYITSGRLAFPTTVILPADGSAPQVVPGYLKPKEMELFLKYFAEHFGQGLSFEDYRRQMKSEW